MTIRGCTALVTGGGSGIGLASAARLAADGAHVTIWGPTRDKLERTEARIGPTVGDGGSIRSIVAGVTVEHRVAAAVRLANPTDRRARHPLRQRRRDTSPGAFDAADLSSVRSTFELNLVGTITCIKVKLGWSCLGTESEPVVGAGSAA